MRFYSKWTGSLWQDDEQYLLEDNLDHDKLSALYRALSRGIFQGRRVLGDFDLTPYRLEDIHYGTEIAHAVVNDADHLILTSVCALFNVTPAS